MLFILFQRMRAALFVFPNKGEWAACAGIAAVFAVLAWACLDLGAVVDAYGAVRPPPKSLGATAMLGFGLLFVPALGEELVFRAALIPREIESLPALHRLFWLFAALGLYVAWHPLQFLWSPERTFLIDGSFLGLTAFLGVAATFMYTLTQSVWPGTIFHWAVIFAALISSTGS